MTYPADFTLPGSLLEQLTQQGLEAIPEMLHISINGAMPAESQGFLNAGPYERSNEFCQTHSFKSRLLL